MAEENQVEPQQITKEPQQVTTKEPQRATKEPQQVTTKNPKKVEAGKRLAESNRKKREVQKTEQAKLEASGVNQYYGIGAVLALQVIGGLGYYIYRCKKVEQPQQTILNHTLRRNCRPTSLRWIKSFLYYKDGQEE